MSQEIKTQLEEDLCKVRNAKKIAAWAQGLELDRHRRINYLTGREDGLRFAIAIIDRMALRSDQESEPSAGQSKT